VVSRRRTSAQRSKIRMSTMPPWRGGIGAYSEGPIVDPDDLAPALERAIGAVKRASPRWSMSSPIRVEGRAMTRLPLSVMMLATGLSAGGFGLVAKAQDLPPGDAANGRARQGAAYNGPAPTLARPSCPSRVSKCRFATPQTRCPLIPSRSCPIRRSPTFTCSCSALRPGKPEEHRDPQRLTAFLLRCRPRSSSALAPAPGTEPAAPAPMSLRRACV
jgi:hypothetical protein